MPTFNGRQIITMPASPSSPASIEWKAFDAVAVSICPFSGQVQAQNWQNSWLEGLVQMPTLTRAQGPVWAAFLLALQGQANVFQFGDPLLVAPQAGMGSGTMVVNGGGQTGYLLSVTGYAGTLTAGDWLQIGYRLYRNLTTQVLTGGAQTLSIWPQIRESPANTTAINLVNTQGIWCLKTSMRAWSQTLPKVYGMQFEIREAI